MAKLPEVRFFVMPAAVCTVGFPLLLSSQPCEQHLALLLLRHPALSTEATQNMMYVNMFARNVVMTHSTLASAIVNANVCCLQWECHVTLPHLPMQAALDSQQQLFHDQLKGCSRCYMLCRSCAVILQLHWLYAGQIRTHGNGHACP